MFSERQGNLFIFIPFSNMNLLISLHAIFQDKESLGREEEVEAIGLEDTSDGGGQDSEEGHEEGAGQYEERVRGDGSTS
jgi:hypothetical protein